MKKLILFIAIVIGSFVFVNPVNAQKHSEYVIVKVMQTTATGNIWITHPNGVIEEIEIPSIHRMNLKMEEREPKLMKVFNRLVENGYEMILIGGPIETYIFAK